MDYTRKTVEGCDCIVWQFPELPEDAKAADREKTVRRKRRDVVGAEHEDMCMLDTSYSATDSPQYCDIIIISKRLNAWETCICDYYKNMAYEVEKRSKSKPASSFSLVVRMLGKVFVTISFWPTTNKIMVQPGDRDQDNLLEWLRSLKFYFNKVMLSLSDELKDKMDSPAPDTANLQIVASHINAPSEDFTATSPSTKALAIGTGGHHHVPASKLIVDLPPIASVKQLKPSPSVCDGTSDAKPEESTPQASVRSKTDTGKDRIQNEGNRSIVVNEMLCFIQNRMDVLPSENIVKTCVVFYKPEVITCSKQHVYEVTENVRNASLRNRKRQPGQNSKEDVMDIIKVLHAVDASVMPCYVAKDLTNLPPLNAYDTDVIKLRSEMNDIKASINVIQESHKDIREMSQILKAMAAKSSKDCHSARSLLPDRLRHDDMHDHDIIANDSDSAAPESDCLSQTYTVVDEVLCSDSEHTHMDTLDNIVEDERDNAPRRPRSNPPKDKSSISSRHEEHIVRGNGHSSVIRAAQQQSHKLGRSYRDAVLSRAERPRSDPYETGKTATGIFITRLEPKTTAAHVAVQVRKESGLTVRPEKLATRHASYSSFYIRGNRRCQAQLLNADLWPKGALVKPFME